MNVGVMMYRERRDAERYIPALESRLLNFLVKHVSALHKPWVHTARVATHKQETTI